jgi:flagellar biosynthesis/type III secretory pathway chaperone
LTRAARDLIRLLDRERDLLKQGAATEAATLAPRKSELADRLEREGAPTDLLARIRAGAERNLPLLRAAKSGTEAAQTRLRGILGGVRTQTYSAQGHTTALEGGRRRIERRA